VDANGLSSDFVQLKSLRESGRRKIVKTLLLRALPVIKNLDRKLHLAVHEHQQVIACELITPEVGDPSAVADLLAQIVTPFKPSSVTALTMASRFSQAVLSASAGRPADDSRRPGRPGR
jgi:hypothetical protein